MVDSGSDAHWQNSALCSVATSVTRECNFCTEIYSLSLTFSQWDLGLCSKEYDFSSERKK